MAYKSLITALTTAMAGTGGNKSVLEAAIKLAHLHQAHLDVLCLGIDQTQPGFYYAGTSAMVFQEALISAQEDAEAMERDTTALMQGQDIRWAVNSATAQIAWLNSVIAHRTRLSDLVVLPKPYGPGRGHDAEVIIEAALFDARVPVLVLPDEFVWPDKTQRVVVAWNESPEALAAVRAALPLLQAAVSVNIAIIDPPPHGPDRSDPGGQLSQMLVRHGVRAEVSVLAKTMPRVSDILSRHCRDMDADLLVMGAYGHSRLLESILGGATRNMLEACQVPVLLAH